MIHKLVLPLSLKHSRRKTRLRVIKYIHISIFVTLALSASLLLHRYSPVFATTTSPLLLLPGRFLLLRWYGGGGMMLQASEVTCGLDAQPASIHTANRSHIAQVRLSHGSGLHADLVPHILGNTHAGNISGRDNPTVRTHCHRTSRRWYRYRGDTGR